MWLIITEALLALVLAVGFIAWVFAGGRKNRNPKNKTDEDESGK